MKKYLLLFVLGLITTFSFGQNNYQDVVHLKNGRTVRGIIIEQVPNKSIKIETADKKVLAFQLDEIEKFTKEPYQMAGGNAIRPSDSSVDSKFLKTGYKRVVELGYQFGTGDYGMNRLKLNIINAYQINPNFSVGIGTGIRYYLDPNTTVVPLFADFRANLSKKSISPYCSLGVGYSFDASNNFDGVGFLVNPTVGASFMISEKTAINVGLGYEIQLMDFHYNYSYAYSNTRNSGAISLIAGITF